jgi:Flp pilus assembly CpaF family ATPase
VAALDAMNTGHPGGIAARQVELESAVTEPPGRAVAGGG